MILFYFFSSRLLFLLFAVLTSNFVSLREGYLGSQFDSNLPSLVWIWANFDGRHFLDIATRGYERTNFAFFPLYPLLISLVGHILHFSHLILGISLSLVFFLVSMFMVYKIALFDTDSATARLAVFFLSIFPLSFFYHSVYTDSLFLLLTTTSFYFARRKYWIWSGIFGALACLSRLSGISLLPALLVEWYLQKKPKPALAALTITFFGFLLYLFYLQIFHGDWLLFQKSFIAWQQQRFILPPQTLFRYFKILFFVDKSLLVYWVAVFELVSMAFYMWLSLYVFKKVRASYGVFMFALLLLVSFTGTLAGTPRYMLHLFPGFIGMAILFGRQKLLLVLVTILFFVLGFVLTALFTRGYFVA